MKWVKKGALIRCCDEHVAAKLLREGYVEFFPVKEEPKPAPAPASAPAPTSLPTAEPKPKKD